MGELTEELVIGLSEEIDCGEANESGMYTHKNTSYVRFCLTSTTDRIRIA
jgi:hypothetical protein